MENEDLNELSIFALRDFARKIGVKSPTSKTKAQIISEINDIKSGIKQPNFSLKRQGRPPKNNEIAFMDSQPKHAIDDFRNLVFSQPAVVFDNNSEVNVVDGYVEIVNRNSAVLWQYKNESYTCYYIPSEVCFISPIKTGDYVICELQMQDRQLVIKKVLNINGTPINKFEKSRADFNKIASILPEKKLELANLNLNLLLGENVYIYGANSNINSKIAINLLKNCTNNTKIYINVAMLDKNLIYLEQLKNADLFVAKLTDKTEYINQILNLAIERIKRLVESKKNVAVVIDDLTTLTESADFVQQAKMLLSLAKATKKYGNVTIFSIVDENSKYKKFADSSLKVLDNGEIIKLNP